MQTDQLPSHPRQIRCPNQSSAEGRPHAQQTVLLAAVGDTAVKCNAEIDTRNVMLLMPKPLHFVSAGSTCVAGHAGAGGQPGCLLGPGLLLTHRPEQPPACR